MNKGVLAIFGYTSDSSAYTLKTYANLYKYPFITMSSPSNKIYEQLERKTLVNDENNDGYLNQEITNETQSINNDEETVSEIKSEKDDIGHYKTLNINEEEILEADEYQINMAPDMIPLLVSLLKYNRWKSVFYLYNYQGGLKIIYYVGYLEFAVGDKIAKSSTC